MVYTSTFNVVFGGQEILDGREEDLPYFPLDKVSSVPGEGWYDFVMNELTSGCLCSCPEIYTQLVVVV